MKHYIKSRCTLLLLLIYFSPVNAAYVDDYSQGFAYFGVGTDAQVSYDAVTDQFTSVLNAITGIDVYTDGTPGVDYNVGGTFTLNATIDASGVLSGGCVNWIGSGRGIAPGSSLLTGTLLDFTLDTSIISPGYDFIIDVTSSEPLFNFGDTMRLELGFVPLATGLTTSFTDTEPYTGQDLVSVTKVPEPGSLALVALGILGIGLSRRRPVM